MKNFLINLWAKLFGKTKTTVSAEPTKEACVVPVVIMEEITKAPVEIIVTTCKCGCGKSDCQCDTNCNCDNCNCECNGNCSCKKSNKVKKSLPKPIVKPQVNKSKKKKK